MLSEWHLTPEYINEQWTDEELYIMVQARADRLRRPTEDIQTPPFPCSDRKMSDVELFKSMKLQVTKR